MRYKVFAGLGGGFGGANYIETDDFENEEEAEMRAWERACEEYDSYAGFHGIRDIQDIMDEDEVSEEEAEEIYNEEREGWVDYWVELDTEEELEGEIE